MVTLLLFDFQSVQGLPVESSVEVFLCLKHVDDHMLIHLLDQLDDIVDLIGRDHGVEQVHLLWL